MELRQLEYFQMASRLKNITRAAERLRVSSRISLLRSKNWRANLAYSSLTAVRSSSP